MKLIELKAVCLDTGLARLRHNINRVPGSLVHGRNHQYLFTCRAPARPQVSCLSSSAFPLGAIEPRPRGSLAPQPEQKLAKGSTEVQDYECTNTPEPTVLRKHYGSLVVLIPTGVYMTDSFLLYLLVCFPRGTPNRAWPMMLLWTGSEPLIAGHSGDRLQLQSG